MSNQCYQESEVEPTLCGSPPIIGYCKILFSDIRCPECIRVAVNLNAFWGGQRITNRLEEYYNLYDLAAVTFGLIGERISRANLLVKIANKVTQARNEE